MSGSTASSVMLSEGGWREAGRGKQDTVVAPDLPERQLDGRD